VFHLEKTDVNQRRVEKSAFEDQSEDNSVGLFRKISLTPAVTSYAHLSAAQLCYLGATGAETFCCSLHTALNSPHPIHASHS